MTSVSSGRRTVKALALLLVVSVSVVELATLAVFDRPVSRSASTLTTRVRMSAASLWATVPRFQVTVLVTAL